MDRPILRETTIRVRRTMFFSVSRILWEVARGRVGGDEPERVVREIVDHARECVDRTGRMSANLGRKPDPLRGSHWRARLEVPRPNHGLATVVTPW